MAMPILTQFLLVLYLYLSAISIHFKGGNHKCKKGREVCRAIELSQKTLETEEVCLDRTRTSTEGDDTEILDFLSSNPTVKQVSMHAMVQLNALQQCKTRMSTNATTCTDFWHWVGQGHCRASTLSQPAIRTQSCPQDETSSRPDHWMTLDECPFTSFSCPPESYEFRTANGSCNNLQRAEMGMANRAFKRYLPPDYGDCIQAPRSSNTGDPLPNARQISLLLYQMQPTEIAQISQDIPSGDIKNDTALNTSVSSQDAQIVGDIKRTQVLPTSQFLTDMHMTFGQLVDHDLDKTAVAKLMDRNTSEMVNVLCGNGCETQGLENAECFPIPLTEDDPLRTANKTCLRLVRSQCYLYSDCRPAARQQANQITSWLDASMVYGSSLAEQHTLRSFQSGLLKTSRHPDYEKGFLDLMPAGNDSSCRSTDPEQPCFLSGDSRQNEQIGLIALHIVFLRYHNHIAKGLAEKHSTWDDEQLFQMSRKILGAVWQHIVYNEYVPSVVGPEFANQFDLLPKDSGFYHGYEPDPRVADGDIANAFSSAAFRFGHSQIKDTFKMTDSSFQHTEYVPLTEVFFNPKRIYESGIMNNSISGVNAAILGMTSEVGGAPDCIFTRQVAGSLFTKLPPAGHGTDLPAINTQRGRDHGIPGYTAWRGWCQKVMNAKTLTHYRLQRAKAFEDLSPLIAEQSIALLKQLYNSVEDVDLYAGAMLESETLAGAVGPTFACIIAQQFSDLKKADRFYYERPNQFTEDQLRNIRSQTLSSVFCVTLEDSQFDAPLTFQKYSMLQSRSEPWSLSIGPNTAENYQMKTLYRETMNNRQNCAEHTFLDYDLF